MASVGTSQGISRTSSASSSVSSSVSNTAGVVLPPSSIQHLVQTGMDVVMPPVPQSSRQHSSEGAGLVAPIDNSKHFDFQSSMQKQYDPLGQIMRHIGNAVHQTGSALINILKLVASIFIPRK